MFLPHVLNTKTLRVSKDVNVEAYAILSHRWDGDREVKFNMLNHVDLRQSAKIAGAARKALELGYEWIWIDSICMDKDSDAETTRSLNSMFEWYSSARVCLTYLSDVKLSTSTLRPFESCEKAGQNSVWFSRGWTLQELIAPKNMQFYDRDWRLIGNKEGLVDNLQQATGIHKIYLKGGTTFREACIATRMSWMAGRDTTQVEDIAYSLLGILGINMTPQYGEGVRAFMRLQREVINNSTDESIFAWRACSTGLKCYLRDEAWSPESWGLLAPSPDCFKKSRNMVIPPEEELEYREYRWTQQGVQFLVPQKSGSDVTNWLGLPRSEVKFALNCWVYEDKKYKTIVIHLRKNSAGTYRRIRCSDLDPQPGAKPSSNRVLGIDQMLRRPLIVVQPEFR